MVFHSVTKSKQRVEAYKKVNGETIFANDLEMKDMQYAYGVSSKYAFAWVKNIDTSQAEQAPGVSCVVTYQDIPGDILMGEDKQDQYVLAVDRVITVGDILAVVVADTMEHAKQAGQLVKIEYEKLHEQHKKQNVICYENEAMGIYFISDPDGYWIEIVPAK